MDDVARQDHGDCACRLPKPHLLAELRIRNSGIDSFDFGLGSHRYQRIVEQIDSNFAVTGENKAYAAKSTISFALSSIVHLPLDGRVTDKLFFQRDLACSGNRSPFPNFQLILFDRCEICCAYQMGFHGFGILDRRCHMKHVYRRIVLDLLRFFVVESNMGNEILRRSMDARNHIETTDNPPSPSLKTDDRHARLPKYFVRIDQS